MSYLLSETKQAFLHESAVWKEADGGLCTYVIVHGTLPPSKSFCGYTAGWQAKMAAIELWIQWCNAHGPHCGSRTCSVSQSAELVSVTTAPLDPAQLRCRPLASFQIFPSRSFHPDLSISKHFGAFSKYIWGLFFVQVLWKYKFSYTTNFHEFRKRHKVMKIGLYWRLFHTCFDWWWAPVYKNWYLRAWRKTGIYES